MEIIKEDLEMLTNIRKYLIEVSYRLFRDYKVYFQAENKPQRRIICDEVVDLSCCSTHSVVCRSFCKMAAKDLKAMYGYDVQVIKCDDDEFSHCDILVTGCKKYIINCLSDLELNQVGMKPKCFCSEKYCKKRYPQYFKSGDFGFLSDEQIMNIDKKIGFCKNLYYDDVIDRLSYEFTNIRKLFECDFSLKKILVGDKSIEELNDLDLLKVKFEFLCKNFNDCSHIIGHIELVRIYKYFIAKLFNKEELRNIVFLNCFFDKNDDICDNVFNTGDDRVRFIAFQVVDRVFIISIVQNSYLCMSLNEWNMFKIKNNVIVNFVSSNPNSFSEILRNKGVGVNIMKHFVVKNRLIGIENKIFDGKSDEFKDSFLNLIAEQGLNITFGDDYHNSYNIVLNDSYVLISINGFEEKYFYDGDNLVLNRDGFYTEYEWKDEGRYDKWIYERKYQ